MRDKIMEILTGLRPECDFENSDKAKFCTKCGRFVRLNGYCGTC